MVRFDLVGHLASVGRRGWSKERDGVRCFGTFLIKQAASLLLSLYLSVFAMFWGSLSFVLFDVWMGCLESAVVRYISPRRPLFSYHVSYSSQWLF